jgi:simple sugar transport system permease protein/D-xylose transport system permease protein
VSAPGRAATLGKDLSGKLVGRVRGGRLGMLPILAALVVIWAVLGAVDPAFLSAENLVNLTLQSVPVGIIALGVVLVLLVGQIDLSVGSVAGLAAAVVAVGTVNLGWPVALAILVALALGVLVGLGYGMLSARLGVPSFVFTLGGLLFLAGLQTRVLGPAGSINLPFESWLVRTVQQGFVPTALAWAVVAAVVLVTGALRFADRARRVRADLPAPGVRRILAGTGLLALVLAGAVAYLGTGRGVGWSVVLFVALVVVVDVLLRRTSWGRSVRAVGSDRRAARLGGISVTRTVVSCFVACSALAALGGVLAAGRLAAANQGTGGADVYLTAIAAAVIGGTSMFGGRGSAWSALVGVLVLQSIANGLTLLDLDLATQSMVTGTVLVLAIVIDTALRRRREA